MHILIVKLSSLGDVVHAMPAVQDLRRAFPQARIDWVVERGFAPLVRRCEGVGRVIESDQRRWRRRWWAADVRAERRAFRAALCEQAYDAVIDLQGLTKSALVAWQARLAPGGRRIAMANRTEGSSYEAPTRWVAHVAVRLAPHVHAVQRARELCAQALGYAAQGPWRFGLHASAAPAAGPAVAPGTVALVHGTSRDDKLWPEPHWLALGQRLIAQGHRLALPQGSPAEAERARRLAQALGPAAEVWPHMDLGQLSDSLAACAGVVGVDSGLSHMAVALDLPHVQLYNFDTAWRTGPLGGRQCSVVGAGGPPLEAVWQAWLAASQSPALGAGKG